MTSGYDIIYFTLKADLSMSPLHFPNYASANQSFWRTSSEMTTLCARSTSDLESDLQPQGTASFHDFVASALWLDQIDYA